MPLDAWISILAMPVGVTICFGPALIIWLRTETNNEINEQNKKK
jgi:hypothetical protein